MKETFCRLSILRNVIRLLLKNLDVCGNTVLQKAIYLVQYLGGIDLGYEYSYHRCGPYSFDLAQDLAIGEALGYWQKKVERISSPACDYLFYRYDAQEGGAEVDVENSKYWGEIEECLTKILEPIQEKNARKFELIATVFYLQEQGIEGKELQSVFRLLKPKYSEEELKEGIGTLKKIKNSISPERENKM